MSKLSRCPELHNTAQRCLPEKKLYIFTILMPNLRQKQWYYTEQNITKQVYKIRTGRK